MHLESFEDLVRLFYDWKKVPFKIKPKLSDLVSFSAQHAEDRATLFYWGLGAVRKFIPSQWWVEQQSRKTPPPFAMTVLELLAAKTLLSKELRKADINLAIDLLKRHFPSPIVKWGYALMMKLQKGHLFEALNGAPAHIQAGQPKALFEWLKTTYGLTDADCISQCLVKDCPHPLSLRVDPNHLSRTKLSKLLQAEFKATASEIQPTNPWGLYCEGLRMPIENHALFKSGQMSIQSESSIVIGHLLSSVLSQSSHVLDMAAPPGGKSLLMWQTANLKSITVMGKSQDRLDTTIQNLKRDKHCQPQGVVHDVQESTLPQFNRPFDFILCDVPCSNLGTLFSKPDVRFLHRDFSDLHQITTLQARFLELAARWIKPGGMIAYVTCSQTHEETEGLLGEFLKDARGQFESYSLSNHDRWYKPGLYGLSYEWFARPFWDGYYIAVLKRGMK